MGTPCSSLCPSPAHQQHAIKCPCCWVTTATHQAQLLQRCGLFNCVRLRHLACVSNETQIKSMHLPCLQLLAKCRTKTCSHCTRLNKYSMLYNLLLSPSQQTLTSVSHAKKKSLYFVHNKVTIRFASATLSTTHMSAGTIPILSSAAVAPSIRSSSKVASSSEFASSCS